MTNYTIRKNIRDGWEAVSQIVLESGLVRDGKPAERVLKISTSKRSSGGIETYASVCIEQDTGLGYKSQMHALYGDYMKRVKTEAARATEKAIRTCHEAALRDVAAIEAEARAFYVAKASNPNAIQAA